MKLDFVIVGGQKSGSSFLQALVADHPDIYMPNGETSYFLDPDFYQSCLEDYLDLKNANFAKIIGIKRPNYIGIDYITKRIYKHNKNCVIIAVLRNPVDRFVSNFFHNISCRFAPNIDINLVIPKILNNNENFLKKYPRMIELIENGLYGKYLSKYLEFFPKQNVLVFTQDELIKNPRQVVSKIYAKLNVSKEYCPNKDIFSSRPQQVDYRKTSLLLKRRISKIKYRYNSEKNRLFKRLDLNIFQKISIIILLLIWHLFNLFGLFGSNKKPKISKENRSLIYSFYEKDINLIEVLFKLNLSSWKY